LLSAHKANKKVLLIIDEAQRLSDELLEEIRLLSTIDLGGRMLLNIFFVGQNEFKTSLMKANNKPIRDRITASYHIEPLTEMEVSSYVKYRLRVAGGTEETFTPLALKEIYHYSRGYPRTINIICDCALLSGYVKDIKRIDSGIVKECATELNYAIEDYRFQKGKTQSIEETPAFPVEEIEEIPENVFQNQHIIRSAPVIVMFALFFGFVIYLFTDSLLDNFLSRTNYPTAVQTLHKPLLTKQDSRRNENPGEQPGDSDTDTIGEPENVTSRFKNKISPLEGLTLGIDAASSFDIFPAKRDTTTIKNEDAITEESIDP